MVQDGVSIGNVPPRGDSFSRDFFKVGNDALDIIGTCGVKAFVLYAYLCRLRGDNDVCVPVSASKIAEVCHMNRATVFRSVTKLRDHGWIEVVAKGGGRKKANVYRVINRRIAGTVSDKARAEKQAHLEAETGAFDDENRRVAGTPNRHSSQTNLTDSTNRKEEGDLVDRLTMGVAEACSAKTGLGQIRVIHLTQPTYLVGLFKRLERQGALEKDDQVNVFAAARCALLKGRNPASYFKDLVANRNWDWLEPTDVRDARTIVAHLERDLLDEAGEILADTTLRQPPPRGSSSRP